MPFGSKACRLPTIGTPKNEARARRVAECWRSSAKRRQRDDAFLAVMRDGHPVTEVAKALGEPPRRACLLRVPSMSGTPLRNTGQGPTVSSSLKRALRLVLRPLWRPLARRLGQATDARIARFEAEQRLRDEGLLRYFETVTGGIGQEHPAETSPRARVDAPVATATGPDSRAVADAPSVSGCRGPVGETDLVAHLRCPTCKGELQLHPAVVTVAGRIKDGVLVCLGAHGSVGLVENFKLDFLPDAVPDLPSSVLTVPVLGERRVSAAAATVRREGTWREAGQGRLAAKSAVGSGLILTESFTDAVVRVVRRPEGGMVDLFMDGRLVRSVDLQQDHGQTVIAAAMATNLPFGPHELAVWVRSPTGRSDHRVLVEGFVLEGPKDSGFADPEPLNRSNEFSPGVDKWIDPLPSGSLILEIGGGDRRRCRPGYFNFEYLKNELADGYADAACLPFADNTFDATCSQAVFEHLPRPFAVADELIRVTRPGGLIVTEVAFMQPVHAVPYHYFNVTPWGAQELFSSCEVLECSWFGNLSATVEWLANSAGLPGRVPQKQLDRVVKTLRRFDEHVTYEHLRGIASGVLLAVRVP